MIIHGENIQLRDIEEKDTDYIVQWRNQKNVRKYFINQEDFTKEGHLNWYHNVVKKKRAVQFIIIDKNLSKPIGSTYIRDIDYECRKGEFGNFYW